MKMLCEKFPRLLYKSSNLSRGRPPDSGLYLAPPFLISGYEPSAVSTYRNGLMKNKLEQARLELQDCKICPRNCGVNRLENKSGACNTGRLAIVSSAFPHFGEESVLQGWQGSGTIFFGMCNLRCVFCQNWDISQKKRGWELKAEEIADLMLKLQNETKCHNINFVTPEHVVPQVVEAIAVAVEQGLKVPIVYNTSSYDSMKSLELLDGLVDIYMPDFKFWTSQTSQRLCKAKDYPQVAKEIIKEMHRQVGDLIFDENGLAQRGLLVRHLVMPGLVEEGRQILSFLKHEVSRDTYVNIMEQYRPTFKVGKGEQRARGGFDKYDEIDRPVESSEMEQMRSHAKRIGLWRLENNELLTPPFQNEKIVQVFIVLKLDLAKVYNMDVTMGRSKYLMKQMLITHLFRGCTSEAFKPSPAFIPSHKQTQAEDVESLEEFLLPTKHLLVLTGAGISTESGIPDYRGEGVGLYATSTKRPIQHKTFMENSKARQSYWARNFVGWPRWSNFMPNIAHRTLYEWERKGRLRHIVTQNVDQLHYKAGSTSVTELHGTTALIKCMRCAFWTHRQAFQRRLEELNPGMVARSDDIRPDGDVELTQEEVSTFEVPNCPKCGTGILKPDVVFFGDNVPKPRVEQVQRQVSNCDSLLVVGSSLTVFSSYRIISQARDLNKPIAIINIGATRADNIANLKLQARAGDLLTKVKLSPL